MGKTAVEEWRSLMPPEDQEEFDALSEFRKGRFMGLGGVAARQHIDTPKYIATANEKVYKNGNSLIVLGYDRTHKKPSGYGGKGFPHCSSVDIIAGLMGYQARQTTSDGSTDLSANPNFKKDAARIYLSQRAAVDDVTYFGLPKGKVGNVTLDAPRSTIALKADTIRVIARENIKLVTRTDVKNSQGGEESTTWKGQYGIDLIGMADDADMQPLVKGANLVACLKDIIDSISKLRDRVCTMADYQRAINTALLSHTHFSPFMIGGPQSTSPDFKFMAQGIEKVVHGALNVEIPMYTEDLMDGTKGHIGIQSRYLLSPGGVKGPRWILSKYNNTN